jgi:hypothetical protein
MADEVSYTAATKCGAIPANKSGLLTLLLSGWEKFLCELHIFYLFTVLIGVKNRDQGRSGSAALTATPPYPH